MLKPFRIRNLYFNSSDLVDCSGVVQLSPQQYDHEIQSTPEAVFGYLDEDDGETVTVGSSFELEQRLLEPPGRFSSWKSHLATDSPPPLHIFDIRRSTRVAEAWRKYAIQYTQPPVPTRAQEPASNEKRKHDDYQSLLARFQVLELEVKLLREAFKMHTITLPVEHHQAQPSVFANAHKNSDLFTKSPACKTHQQSALRKHNPQIEPGSNYSNDFGYNWWRQQELHPLKHDNIEAAPIPQENPGNPENSRMTAHERNGYPSSLQLAHTGTLSSERGAQERCTSDQIAQKDPQHRLHSAGNGYLRDIRNDSGSLTGGASHEISDIEKLRIKHFLADECSATLSGGTSTLQPTTRDLENATISFPVVASPRPALKSLLDLEPEAEIARFPTIFQLEKEGLRSTKGKSTTAQDPGSSTASLTRAKTVTSSNPAARLLKPFDPAAEGLGVSQNPLPRRSGTERHRRRPYAEQSTGTGRTLWESFERPGPREQITAPRLSDRPTSRPIHAVPENPQQTVSGAFSTMERRPNDPAPLHPNPSINRSQSLNHHSFSDNSHLHRLAPRRSAFYMSGTERSQLSTPTIEQSRHQPAAATSTLSLAQPPATDSNPNHSKNVQSCISMLQEMGYKPHSRLPIYAEACDGNLSKAMTMAEEDDKATQESRKVIQETEEILTCVRLLKEMGYGAHHHEEQLTKFARDADGQVGLAVERIEAPSRDEMEEWQERRGLGFQGQSIGGGMPGSWN